MPILSINKTIYFYFNHFMVKRALQYIRKRWHPLWRLRRSPVYRSFQNRFDVVYFTSIKGINTKVAVKFLRDLTWVLDSSILEPEINAAFKLVLDTLKPRVFWDIGANIGYYSWVVRHYPSIESIVLFEPDPVNYSLIQKTINKNRFMNCEAINVAVSDQVGNVTFVVDQASGATGSIKSVSTSDDETTLHADYGMGNNSIRVKTITIDSFSWNRSLPEFIKIDVEGAEHLILNGAKTIFCTYHPTLIIETKNSDFIRQLVAMGYTAFRVDNENLVFVNSLLENELSIIKQQLPLAKP